jgi:hypothetical protein
MGAFESCEEIISYTKENITDGVNYWHVECMIRQWGMTPLGCIGIVLNLIALWAWSAEREFKPLTFYIKCLAVSDILYMLFYMSVYDLNSLGRKSRGHSFVSLFIAFRWMIVFSTTCIAIIIISVHQVVSP